MIKALSHHIYSIQMQTTYMDRKCLKNYLQMVLDGYIMYQDLMRDSKKITMKVVIYGISLKQMYNIQKNYLALIKIYLFYQKENNQKKQRNLFVVQKKEKYVIHIRALKRALNHGLILKKVHRVIKFNQEAWLKPYIVMNTKLRKEAKNKFENNFFKLKNNSFFGKTMENVRKHRDITLVATEEKRIKLISEPNYHTTKKISKKLLVTEMKKANLRMNKPMYLGMSILDISKTLMYEFWYDYIKPKYKDKAKPC